MAAFRAALEVWTREQVPLDWAITQNNLGNALERLGERESGTQRLEEAVAAFRAALQELPRERAPLRWAITKCNLAGALINLDEQYKTTAYHNEALAELQDIFQTFSPGQTPIVFIDRGCIWSGAISIATVVNDFFGDNISYQQISKELSHIIIQKGGNIRNNLSYLDLQIFAERHGYEATGFGHLKIDDVINLPKRRTPLLITYSNRTHYAVLNGVEGQQVCLADPGRGNPCISMTQFAQEWASNTEFGNTALIIGKAGFGTPSDALK